MNAINALVVSLVLASSVLAQQGPPRDRRPGDDMAPPPREMRPGERAPGERGQMSPIMIQVEATRAWMEMVDRYAKLARDPAAAGIAGVIGANDLLRNKPEQAIEFFNKMLRECKNDSVQRAIRMQLVELYTKTGQQEPALEQLRVLMTSAPVAGPESRPAEGK